MNKAEEMGFVQQTHLELSKRISQTNGICGQFQDSYSEYSSKERQISLLVLFGIIILMLILAMLKMNTILVMFPTQNYGRDSLLITVALLSMFLYMVLHICKNIMCIKRIDSIDELVYEVREVEEYLQSNLNDLGNIVASANRDIFGQTNKTLKSDYDADADIAKYSDILERYQKPDDNILNVALTVTHWLSSFLVTGIFLFISTSSTAAKIGEWLHVKEYGFISLFYATGFAILYIIFQNLFAKISLLHMRSAVKKATEEMIGYFFIICICGSLLYIILNSGTVTLFGNATQAIKIGDTEYVFSRYFMGFFEENQFFEFIRSMSIPYIPLIGYVFFLSIICYICRIDKHVKYAIGIFFTTVVYGILLYLIFGLEYIYFGETIDKLLSLGFVVNMFLAYIPLMTAAFFSSIIAIMCRIEKRFIYVITGSGIVYTVIYLIIDFYTAGIKYYLIGDIIIYAIALIVCAIPTAIALLPGLAILFLADSGDSELAKQDEFRLLITFLIVAGLMIVVIKPVTEIRAMLKIELANVEEKPAIETFIDSRDNKTYKITKIGSKTWMAENLNYAKSGECYGKAPANCQKYGKHFSWAEAKRACPAGWHLPSNAEWDALYRFADGNSGTESPYKSETAGKYLKAKRGWNPLDGRSGNGEDAYGFAALPGGSNYSGYNHIGNNGYWWSSSEEKGDKAYYRFMLNESSVAGWNKNSKKLLLNVRCVKN
jgi:uncharacterized protein (TIGR02145 family)